MWGETALILAATCGDVIAARTLLEHHADAHIKDKYIKPIAHKQKLKDGNRLQ